MKPKFRVILDQALEEGVKRGYRRAFKHIENPTEESICQHIEEQVMSSLYEYFDFEAETND
jgi:archaeosine-15-forming tRNA-guanine transglycosylase